jgi:hypothetical protein
MCDYGLEQMESRPAKVGDRLASTSFPNSITRDRAACGGQGALRPFLTLSQSHCAQQDICRNRGGTAFIRGEPETS